MIPGHRDPWPAVTVLVVGSGSSSVLFEFRPKELLTKVKPSGLTSWLATTGYETGPDSTLCHYYLPLQLGFLSRRPPSLSAKLPSTTLYPISNHFPGETSTYCGSSLVLEPLYPVRRSFPPPSDSFHTAPHDIRVYPHHVTAF